MRAVVKAKPKPGIEVRNDIPVPRPKSGWALVRVKAAAVCGSDVHIYEWTPNYEFMIPYMPIVLGHEFSGEVAEVGEGVSEVSVGDRVSYGPGKGCSQPTCYYCRTGRTQLCRSSGRIAIGLRNNGGMADYVSVPSDSLWKLTEDISYEVGALCEPLSVALHAVDVSNIRAGQTVAILGPGPIGLLTLLCLRASGLRRVFLTGKGVDSKRLELARRLGADAVFDVDDVDAVEEVMNATGGIGVDAVYEATGDPTALQQGLRMVRVGGQVVALGIHPSTAALDLTDLVRSEKRVVGSYAANYETWTRLLAMLLGGLLDMEPIVSHRVSLDEAIRGFEYARKREGVKVLFIP